MRALPKFWAILMKDLASEVRTKEAITSTVFFALLVLLVFNFAFDPGTRDVTVVGAGILWIAFLFAGILAMNRLMLNEREDGGIEGLMLCPVERTTIYLAKCAGLFLLLLVAEALTLALFVLFFNVAIGGHLLELALVTLLATVGLSCLGTTFAAMAVRTRTREVMLPLLLIPIAVPLLIAAVQTTSAVLSGRGLAEETAWLQLLIAFDAIFLAVGYLTFPAILEE